MSSNLDEIYVEKIKACTLLPDIDKDFLLSKLAISYGHAQAALPSLSIFAPVGDSSVFDGVQCYSYPEAMFYVSLRNKSHSGFLIDRDGKIVYRSRYYTSHLNAFVDNVDHMLRQAKRAVLEDSFDLGEGFVTIERWFFTYGHFKDEAYSLGSYLRRGPTGGETRILLDYPTDSGLDGPNFRFNHNYRLIDKLIFDGRSVNAYLVQAPVMKLRNVTIIENGFNSLGFHRFPSEVATHIANRVGDAWKGPKVDRVFLTRSASYRDIDNKAEVENFFASNGYRIIDPEAISYQELVSLARNASHAALYYGSALTNMVYFPPGATITILKSQSYMEENFNLWLKIVAEYQLRVQIVNAVENRVEISELLNLDN